MDYEDTTENIELDETTEYENKTATLNAHQILLRDFDSESFDIYLKTFRIENPEEEEIKSINHPEPYPPNYSEDWE